MKPKLYWLILVIFASISVGAAAQVAQPITQEDAVLQNYQVQIEIENQIAHVSIEQTYFNPTDRVLEEIYLFPVQQGATISSLTLCNDDTGCTEGELLGSTEARQIYENIVRLTRDPALLEYLDDRSFQVRVFPINPDSTQTIKLSYQVVLERSNELVEVIYPITSQKTIQQMLIQATIKSDDPIGNLYSPSHTISQERISENEVRIGFEANNLRSDNDFKFYYAVAQDGIALDVLSFKPNENEDGYFLMLVSWPQIDQEPLPKDIIFVLDTSGSMSGEKIVQAKESLRHALGRLNPSDRFGLITFSDVIRAYNEELISVSDLDRADIESYIDNVDAAGGTNIHSALMRGLSLFEHDDSSRPQMVVFLTDGLPTAGETGIKEILADVQNHNGELNCRIFTFGVGYDVNTILLDTLSYENGGFTSYVEPDETIEDAVASFYDRAGTPLIWDLSSEFSGVDVYDIYPVKMPDLFAGDMLEIVGRYRNGGEAEISLAGQGAGLSQTFANSAQFSNGWTDHEYLQKIWAARAIGYLLREIRLNGENPELVERVRQLGEEYGIATPYNSFLANPEEDGDDPFADPAPRNSLQMQFRDNSSNTSSGESAVAASEALDALSNISSADEAESFASSVQKVLSGTTFERQEGGWIDVEVKGRQPDLQIEFGSDAYFALANRSDLTQILKLGSNVVFTTATETGEELTIEIADAGLTSADQLPVGLTTQVAQNSDNTSSNQTTENNNNNNDNSTDNSSDTNNQSENGNQNTNDENGSNVADNQANNGTNDGMSTLLLVGIGLVVAILVGAGYFVIKK